MAKGARVDTAGVADLLGVAPRTVASYVQRGVANGRGVAFPLPVAGSRPADWVFSVRQVLAWDRHRTGQGGPGVRKDRGGTVCESCGAVVARRVLDGDDDRLKCRPCFVADGARGPVSG